MASPRRRPAPYTPPPPPRPPAVAPVAKQKINEASIKARSFRQQTGGYQSTILTGGLGILEAASTRSNTLG